MPFKSSSQARACFAKHDSKWDCHAWAAETPGGVKNLPERIGSKKPAVKPKKTPYKV